MKNLVPIIFSLLLFLINTAAIAQNRVVVIPMGGNKGTVAKTGLTKCYDTTGKQIDCAGTGQDGELQKGYAVSPRFTDNSNGTVTDRLTGLIWLKNGNCNEFFVGDNTGNNERSWQAALDAVNKLSSGSCGLKDGSEEGDWRLPNIRELLSLVDYSQTDPALPPGYPFTDIASDWYWSSTTHAGGKDVALRVDLFYGGDGNYYKSYSHNVSAVRGGR